MENPTSFDIFPETDEAALRASLLAATNPEKFTYKEVEAKLPHGITLHQRLFRAHADTLPSEFTKIQTWIQQGTGDMPV